MALAQVSPGEARKTPRRFSGPRFMGRRAREAGYGLFFTSVFLLCQSPANSLAIDDIRVLSRLGEPLVAEVVVSPAAGEVLNRGCFSTQRSAGGFPDVGRVRLTLTRKLNSTVLRIAGARPVREPMSEFMLQVKCPGVPTIVKNFLVMVDPPTVPETIPVSESFATSTVVSAPRPAQPRQANTPRARSDTNSRRGSIQPGSQYKVQFGDTLSNIAARVTGRPDWSVWPISQHIYAANPGAFLLGDPNVIAENATIFIPRLSDVNMALAAAGVRAATIALPARPTPASDAASIDRQPVARPQPVATSQPAVTESATPVAKIMPTPTVTTAPVKPVAVMILPSMQLTTGLFDESQIKLKLRAQGMPSIPAVVATDPVIQAPVDTTPTPQSEPERPDNALTDTRAALPPGQAAQSGPGLNWLWIIVGLLAGLLAGAFAAVGVFRRNLRQEYEHDVREAVQRQVHTDRLHAQRDHTETGPYIGVFEEPAATAAPADAFDSHYPAETTELPAMDHTVEMRKADALDFEVSQQDEPAASGSPETLEMPGISNDLDLELTAETGRTGQHEVDFDLLEAAYSDDYHSEFVEIGSQVDDETAGTDEVAGTDETADDGDEANRYYHLENRDPTDEAPLPIELGEDEMGTDENDESDGKVVRFHR